MFRGMPYKVVFRNGENAKNGELIVEASKIETKTIGNMEFFDDSKILVAVIPLDRILYVKKVETD